MYVHSYKGFLATIGVMPLSVTAAMLEIAAQNEDRATIDVHHDSFVRNLREITAAVVGVLNAMGKKSSSGVISATDRDWLYEELTQLKSAIVEMRMKQVDSIMDDLLAKQWTKNTTEHLEKIMQCITLFDWQEAIGRVEQLLQEER
jgi:HPt (histidine-containing phosphotransfer) domain-containing protein